MNKRTEIEVFVVFIGCLAAAGCADRSAGPSAETHASHESEHGSAEQEEREERAADHDRHHHRHDRGEDEPSDLDRPVDELFAATCEHEMKAHQCDECRYEVGVVKAAASLFEGGLLGTVRAEKKAVAVPLSLTGEVRFDERRVAHLSTLAGGIIRKVHVTLGDEVKRGQPLVEIESVAVGDAQAVYLEAQAILVP